MFYFDYEPRRRKAVLTIQMISCRCSIQFTAVRVSQVSGNKQSQGGYPQVNSQFYYLCFRGMYESKKRIQGVFVYYDMFYMYVR